MTISKMLFVIGTIELARKGNVFYCFDYSCVIKKENNILILHCCPFYKYTVILSAERLKSEVKPPPKTE